MFAIDVEAKSSAHPIHDDEPDTPEDPDTAVRRRARHRWYTATLKVIMCAVALGYIFYERDNWRRNGDYYYQWKPNECEDRFPQGAPHPDYIRFAMTIISLYLLNTFVDWVESIYVYFHPQTYMVHRIGFAPKVSMFDPFTAATQSSMGFVNYFSSFASLSVITGTRMQCGIRTIDIEQSRSIATGLVFFYIAFMVFKLLFHVYPKTTKALFVALLCMTGFALYIVFSDNYDMYRDGMLRLPAWTVEGLVFTGNLTIMFSEAFFALMK